MGVPVIPNVNQTQALTNLLESIALEETALAHVVNAEAEKIQAIAYQMHTTCPPNSCQVLDFQKSVNSVMQTAVKMQILLQFKLENVLDAKLKLETCNPHPHPCPPQPCPPPCPPHPYPPQPCPPQPCPPQPCPPQPCPPHPCPPQPCPPQPCPPQPCPPHPYPPNPCHPGCY